MKNLLGKTGLVTGASRGIGRATALTLAAAGAQILVHYSSSEREAEDVVAKINQAGGRAQKIAADLRLPDGPHKLAKQVRSIVGDRLDILVANAGISKATSIEASTVEDFDALFAVNVRAPYFLVQQLLPTLHEGSSVVFFSSLAAHSAVGTLSAYAATKGAVDTMVSISPLRSARAASASTPSHPESLRRTCPVSPRPRLAVRPPLECRRSSA